MSEKKLTAIFDMQDKLSQKIDSIINALERFDSITQDITSSIDKINSANLNSVISQTDALGRAFSGTGDTISYIVDVVDSVTDGVDDAMQQMTDSADSTGGKMAKVMNNIRSSLKSIGDIGILNRIGTSMKSTFDSMQSQAKSF